MANTPPLKNPNVSTHTTISRLICYIFLRFASPAARRVPSRSFFLSFHGSAFFEIKCIILPFVVAARRLFIAKMCHICLSLVVCSVLSSKRVCKNGVPAGSTESSGGAPKSHIQTTVVIVTVVRVSIAFSYSL